MSKNQRDYMEKRGQSLVAKAPLRVILPKENFRIGISSVVDEKIETYGVFQIEILDSSKQKFNVSLPLIIALSVINREEDSDNIYLLYDKNEVMLESMAYFKGPKPANAFLGLFSSAKFSPDDEGGLVKMFTDNLKLNGASTGVNSELVEAMVSELIRYKKDTTKPFRLVRGKVKDEDKEFLAIKEVARASSVFSALSFEDTKKAIQASISMTRRGAEQSISPVEKLVL